jgi:hypothetical protein
MSEFSGSNIIGFKSESLVTAQSYENGDARDDGTSVGLIEKRTKNNYKIGWYASLILLHTSLLFMEELFTSQAENS